MPLNAYRYRTIPAETADALQAMGNQASVHYEPQVIQESDEVHLVTKAQLDAIQEGIARAAHDENLLLRAEIERATAEREFAQAEIKRLTAERDAAQAALREILRLAVAVLYPREWKFKLTYEVAIDQFGRIEDEARTALKDES